MNDSLPTNIKILEEKILFMDGANRLCYLLACDMCGKTSYHPHYALLKSNKDRNQKFFCSQQCSKTYYKKSQMIICETCGKQFEKRLCEINKTSHHFCSRNCAAVYHNSHKNYGSRRSKLEIFIESKIKDNFPHLECIFNGVDVIGSEIDLYFPNLKLAIQLNGPLHYKPIYGDEKFARIITIDENKRVACKALQIDLIEIDVSKDRSSNDKIQNQRWQEVSSLIESRFRGRLLA